MQCTGTHLLVNTKIQCFNRGLNTTDNKPLNKAPKYGSSRCLNSVCKSCLIKTCIIITTILLSTD